MRPRAAGRAAWALAAAALGAGAAGARADADRFPELPGPGLEAGRAVWVANCMTCHGYGIAGAPIPTDPEAWAARLEKPRETLYDHALNGFFGPDDTMMPARGGNDALTDEEVKRAVDYMAAVAALAQLKSQPPESMADNAADAATTTPERKQP